jgi:hypothetical protein
VGPRKNETRTALRRHLQTWSGRGGPSLARPDEVEDPYYRLGTHPDVVTRLWDELPALLPADCRFVFNGAPVLMRPDSRIVFGFAGGTHAYALRLPEDVRAAALAAGARRVHEYGVGPPLDLATIGPEWVFGAWLKGEEEWCLAAYGFAAAT